MKSPTDLDRRKPAPDNQIFEAHDWRDPTNLVLYCYRDEEDKGAMITFCAERNASGSATMHQWMWINADQCEEFGNALLAAAKIIRSREVA